MDVNNNRIGEDFLYLPFELKETDQFDELLQKLPPIHSAYENLLKELKSLFDGLKGDSESRCEGKLLTILNAIYGNTKSTFYPVLIRFMSEHNFLMTEVLAKALLEKAIQEATGGRSLAPMKAKIQEWQGQFSKEAPEYHLAELVLDTIREGKVTTQEELRAWIQNEPNLYIRVPNLTQEAGKTFFLGQLEMEVKDLPPFTKFDKIHEKITLFSNHPSILQETKEFLQTDLLPKVRGLILANKATVNEVIDFAIKNFIRYSNQFPSFSSEIQLFQEALNLDVFPLVLPYPYSGQSGEYRFGRARKKKKDLREEPKESEEEPIDPESKE